jgi:hypothetical protein
MTLDKIDIWIHASLTKLVLKWVKWQKHQKHKYDLLILLKTWYISLLIVFLAGIFAMTLSDWTELFTLIIFGFIIGLETYELKEDREMAEMYTRIFLMRKHPAVYQSTKTFTEFLFEEPKDLRQRLLIVDLSIALSILLLSLIGIPSTILFWLLITIFHIYQRYNSAIFDMDEPPDEPKKVKTTLTEALMQAWQRAVERVLPSTNIKNI